jgi:predicted DsbA family dithiol-disulfide isomerase
VGARIRVDIISDIVCPWCHIGFRQLMRALEIARLDGDIRWHPFELNPDMPPEGEDVGEHIRRKYGATPEQSDAARNRMADIAAPLGIDFGGRAKRIWNSFSAHQLLYWAKDSGRQTELKLAFLNAYFGRGADVSDPAVLLAAVEGVGLDRSEASEILADQRFAPAVRALEARWAEMGITGVPAFIIAERALVMGAQGEQRLAAALAQMVAINPEG